eukprot:gb/GECG01016621.1/.p1 GENE.gb/GECG01016621.1/~~gb/GECG01016621.1/.p1  ORF type:complete len:1218 (+),score=196.26 gb/GECG01016621.1/:1-3654(+)
MSSSSSKQKSSSLDKLTHLNLVSKICEALDNTVGFSDKDLAEFIVYLAEENPRPEDFQRALRDNGAEFGESFVGTLLRLIYSFIPSLKEKAEGREPNEANSSKQPGFMEDAKAQEFPALSMPNREQVDEDNEPAQESKTSRQETGRKRSTSQRSPHRDEYNDDDRGRSSSSRKGSSDGRDHKRSRSERHSRDDDSDRRDRRRRHHEDDDDDNKHRNGRDYRDNDHGSRKDRSSSHRGNGSSSRGGESFATGSNRQEPGRRSGQADEPELYGIYPGKVSRIMEFGAFVELDEFPDKEGLVHVSQMTGSGKIDNAKDYVRRGQRVFIKVISKTGSKMTYSMKDCDQKTGEDLLPQRQQAALEASASSGVNPSKPDRHTDVDVDKVLHSEKKGEAKRMSSPERFEAKQLAAAGVLPPEEMPGFDEVHGVLGEDETEETGEVEVKEEEPPFLRGQTQNTRELSPVKVVKNPDGSLQRAAMTQSALQKERRELKTQQQNQLLDNIPKDLSRGFNDPMPEVGDKMLAGELRSTFGGSKADMPEWKKKSMANDVSYGKITNKSIKEQRETLPIYALRDEFLQAVANNQVLVVIGETGSGKTTQMTQYLAEAGYTSKGMVGCTQPRRVAAVSVAKRVAEEFGCRVGQDVGYSIRFEDCTSQETQIKYMTDGMLMREYLMDRDLKKYSVIMLDEAHERTIHTDVLFGLMKELAKKRPDFRLIVTSATLDAEKFSEYFFECPVFTIPGRTYDVEILYTKEPESDYVDAALITCMQIHLREPPGDILVFLTGQEEIDTACEILYERMKALGPDVPELIILPVYGALPSEMQSRIFEPAPSLSRKCIIATNIAEASLTIDGIYYVVDPGFCKQKVFNPKTGMDSLVVVPISQASARQRAGRAGRTGPGKCYRLYTENAFKNEMLPNSVPEIQRTNLANVVLQLKAMGINDLLHFDFMDPPPVQTLVSAMEHLYALGALDDEGLLTRLGRKMAEFPLEPSLSKTLLISVDLGCSEEVLTIVAMLSVEQVFYRPKEKQAQADQKKAKFHMPEGDHLTFLNVYESWKASKFSNAWCHENFVQSRAMRRADDVRKQLLSIMDRYKLDVTTCKKNYQLVQKAITAGFFTHAAKKDPQEGYKTLTDGQTVYMHPSSSLFNRQPDWCIYHELIMTSKEYMRNVMAIDSKWLIELAPRRFQQADPNQISKQKRREKLEPLYDRFNEPGAWRLSKRRG